ncbi:MAG: enoyl-CoA hydratase/isomerase family protein [Calditrichaeota bacterium]|nr:MAG: enoyl-CoA hydratase/isomerase family protein [Calditrichota bacterium]
MSENGFVRSQVNKGIGEVRFYHPKKNSLPGHLLKALAEQIHQLGQNPDARVILLRSEGDGPFCAGASFDELLAVDSPESGREFFMGFARVILAMIRAPKFVLVRVQGKAVGGGVGLIAAADYALATDQAALKLSELALGIGPFVIGPVVERKVGTGAFAAMGIDTEWRSAQWAAQMGLYAQTFPLVAELDEAVSSLAARLAESSPLAMAQLKQIFWQDTERWEQLLAERAQISGRLILSPFSRQVLQKLKKK